MRLDINGHNLIKQFEGLRLTSYKDGAGIWTIGYGSTYYVGGAHVKQGDTLASDAQACALFMNTLASYEQAVNRYVKAPLTQNQFNALVSFTYNEGIGALQNSTLLKKLNDGNYEGAANQFVLWVKITNPRTGLHEISKDLVKRRSAERALFLKA